jgi:hypothetical protein
MSRAQRFGIRYFSHEVVRRWLAAATLLSLGLVGCTRSDSDATGSHDQRLTAQDGSTGVALCDSYLDDYESCVIPRLPSAQVARHRSGIVRQREAWASLASTSAKQEALLRVCRSAIETARREFPSCEFSGG